MLFSHLEKKHAPTKAAQLERMCCSGSANKRRDFFFFIFLFFSAWKKTPVREAASGKSGVTDDGAAPSSLLCQE